MIVCIDAGGTNTRIGVSRNGKSFINIEKFDTPQEFDKLIKLITASVGSERSQIEKISFGVAGIVDRKQGRIRWAPHKKNWNGVNAFENLKNTFPNTRMKIENDANLATLGEAVFGAGKDYSIVSYLTLSTGIGGGLVIDKKIVRTKSGFEPGHQIIHDHGEKWACGQIGCLESFASGTAFEKRFGMKGEECEDGETWLKYAKDLAIGISNIIVLWSPEVIVLGGGVSSRFDYFIEPLKSEIKKLSSFADPPEIVKYKLSDPGLYGGLALSAD